MAQLTDKQMELLNAWNTLSNSYNKNGLYQAGGYEDNIKSGQNTLADTYFKEKGANTAGFSDEQLQQIQQNAMQGDKSKDLTHKSNGEGGFFRTISDGYDNALNFIGNGVDGVFDAGVDFAGQLTNNENADWVKDLKNKTNGETFQMPLSVAADLALTAAGPVGWGGLIAKSVAENGDNIADWWYGVDENGNELTDAQKNLSGLAGLGGIALSAVPLAGGKLAKVGSKAAARELEKTTATKAVKEASQNVDAVRTSADQALKNANEAAAKETAAKAEYDNLLSNFSSKDEISKLRDARNAHIAAKSDAKEIKAASDNAQKALDDAIANRDRLSDAAKAIESPSGLENFAKTYADDLSLTRQKSEGPQRPGNALYGVMDKILGRNTANEATEAVTEEAAKSGLLSAARNAAGKGMEAAGKPIGFIKQQLPVQLAAQGTTVANLMANGADANDIMEYFSNPANVASMLLASKMAGKKANAAMFNTPRNLYGNAAFVNEAGNAADNYYGRTEESQDLQDVQDALALVGNPENQAELYTLLLNGVDTSGLNLERDYPKEKK